MNTPMLLVEDEEDLQSLLAYNLERAGYRVTAASSGEDALRELEQMVKRQQVPRLILLDLMLPQMSGLEVCRHVKARPEYRQIPLVMLTARGEEADIVRGLEMGADDYITKPFSPRVLMARLQAVLRRADEPEGGKGPMRVGALTVDPERHEVVVDGVGITLTATEFKLIQLLGSKPGRVWTRQQIIESIHEGYAAVTDRSVDVQVVSLRRKLGSAGRDIETVRGVGYRLKG